ncbi:universal stress family isoform B [Chlorella sorokiniana]|uniref:Universal stress family isoform B n=1 Tax=Chlorella sorokiniana TaxID=3076 RepID=A0A2P6TYC9_CHLSO|nr:universal stress family isoform B [Chlorella sorokiniana]|eukprot:PRW59077.1 universal stress family isoform B [Chlorella sorokiniana]
MGRSILVAVDASAASQAAALWAAHNLARPGDSLHVVAIAPPIAYAMTPAAPIASAGAVAALSLNWEQQRRAEEEQCRALLHEVVHKLPEARREELDIHRHVLPAAGGASGVAESVVEWSKQHGVDVVVVGSRGMGAMKSTLMSLVGLGSVSGYLVHHMHCPVAVCRGREQDAQPKAKRKVMVSLDDSYTSKKALEWAVNNVLGPDDELHLVCVALPIPYPVSPGEDYTAPPLSAEEWRAEFVRSLGHAEARAAATADYAAGPLQIVADDAAASEVLEADEFDAATQDSIHYARETVSRAVDAAASQVDRSKIFFKALAPEGGASDVGQSVVHYAKENGVDLVVLGARGMGSWKRAIMSFVGLGSVSDFVVHHLEAPVIIVKHQ